MSYILLPSSASPASAPFAEEAPDAAELAQQVRQEVARLRAKAEAEGRAAGEASGRASLQAEAEVALEPARAALNAAWSQLAAPLAQQQQALSALVTELAFSLCRHILGVEVKTSPDGLTALVTRLIKEAAAERNPRQSLVIRVNPADHEWVQPVLNLENAHLLSDSAISRGGAVVEIIAPDGDPVDKIEWDATLETRIASVREALGLPAEVA